jgi:molecular chaperone DnaK
MPMVSRILRELIGKEPDSSLSPDEAVAHGAALYAGMLLGNPGSGGLRRCELIHVNSHSLGVVGVEEKSQQRVNAVLIPRNTPIPAQAIKSFRTIEEGQRNVAVPVVEGESERPEFCVPLGKCVVRGLPPGLPKGTRVDVAYRYLANGRLAVSAWVPDSGNRPRWRSFAIALPSRGTSPSGRGDSSGSRHLRKPARPPAAACRRST